MRVFQQKNISDCFWFCFFKTSLYISESVECLVCIEEDLRRNIFTDFTSINWLTVSFQNIYIFRLLQNNLKPHKCAYSVPIKQRSTKKTL